MLQQCLLSQLLKAEIAEREVRSIADHTKVARFPAYKDLTRFDCVSSEINEAKVRQLHRCEFIEAAENVVLIGGPGTGKSHTATAIGVQAIKHHRRKGPLLLDRRIGQCAGTRKSARQG